GGKAYCWGWNFYGEIGNGVGQNRSSPTGISYGWLGGRYYSLSQISAGGFYTCALNTEGRSYCWGFNGHGQLGFDDAYYSYVPRPVSNSGALSGKRLVKIAAGYYHTCALDTEGRAYCWGANNHGQIGNGAVRRSSGTKYGGGPAAVDRTGVLRDKRLVDISVGLYHTCALSSEGQAYCWGNNGSGQLGNGGSSDSVAPVLVDMSRVSSGGRLVRIFSSGDSNSTCSYDVAGQVYCWGQNDHGQLGDGTTADRNAPTPVYPTIYKTYKKIKY